MFRTSDTVAAAVASVPRISSPHLAHAASHPAKKVELISGAAVGRAVWIAPGGIPQVWIAPGGVAPGGVAVMRSPLDNPAQPKPAQPNPALSRHR